MRNHVAIIGLGISGLACASRLAGQTDLTLFDKSRGVSGRMSTRRSDPYSFDHGTIYFRSSSDLFSTWLEPFVEAGVVMPWPIRRAELDVRGGASQSIDNVWVAAPSMNALGKAVIKQLETNLDLGPNNLHLGTQIERIEVRADGKHLLHSETQCFGPFDWVISAIPSAQAKSLIPEQASFHAHLGRREMIGCHSLMLGFEDDNVAGDMAWDVAKFDSKVLHKAVWNHRKPARPKAKALLVQTKYDWSEPRLDWSKDDIVASIVGELDTIFPKLCEMASHRSLHSWRYAASKDTSDLMTGETVSTELDTGFSWDMSLKLAAIGDWQLGSKVENGFVSGDQLAQNWIAALTNA
jgi:renalase